MYINIFKIYPINKLNNNLINFLPIFLPIAVEMVKYGKNAKNASELSLRKLFTPLIPMISPNIWYQMKANILIFIQPIYIVIKKFMF